MGMEGFFNQAGEIEAEIEKIYTQLGKLQAANRESQNVTKASAMKEIKQRMEKDIDEVKRIALKVKRSLEVLDRENVANRRKPGCEKGTGVDRSRTSMIVSLKKKLQERMSQFQALRQNIHDEYREVVQRRVFTVTGTRADEEMIDNLIETGSSEQIFANAIQGYGRGQIVDTLAEIQERHDAALELEQKLLDLQQAFMDMSVLVDSQGEMLNDIEAQVTNAVEHVHKGTVTLKQAKQIQKSTRKYMFVAIIMLLIIIAIALGTLWKSLPEQSPEKSQ